MLRYARLKIYVHFFTKVLFDKEGKIVEEIHVFIEGAKLTGESVLVNSLKG